MKLRSEAFKMWWYLWWPVCCNFLVECLSERIVKIGLYFVKLWQKLGGRTFLTHLVDCIIRWLNVSVSFAVTTSADPSLHLCLYCRGVREWLLLFPFPLIPVKSLTFPYVLFWNNKSREMYTKLLRQIQYKRYHVISPCSLLYFRYYYLLHHLTYSVLHISYSFSLSCTTFIVSHIKIIMLFPFPLHHSHSRSHFHYEPYGYSHSHGIFHSHAHL